MATKFQIGDLVRVASDEGLDTPREARGTIGRITGYLKDDAGNVVEWWVTSLDFAKFNATRLKLSSSAREKSMTPLD